ncbi:MAG: hypothetical protein OXT67_06285 [Zetaproteobacteria bacterium]|nr:hypothetical protein [Zetaproteobacteria bacterium]
MARYFQKTSVEEYIKALINDDREVMRIIDSWNIEREEIAAILVSHYKKIGILYIEPLTFAKVVYGDIIHQLKHSPEIRARLAKVQEEIARQKSKHSRR